MSRWIQIASGISNQWSLAAFVVAAILFLALKTKAGKINSIGWISIIALVVVGIIPILASTYLEKTHVEDRNRAIYRVALSLYQSMLATPDGTSITPLTPTRS